jgi:hypothetical protein
VKNQVQNQTKGSIKILKALEPKLEILSNLKIVRTKIKGSL